MWSFNVTRSLVREAGLKLVPDQVPVTDLDMLAVADSYVKSRPKRTRCVIKVHSMINVSSSVKIIRNRRDLRDRLFSYLRFMQQRFNERDIVEAVSWSREMDTHYDRWPAESILNIPFESIGTNSTELIRQIAEFVGLPAVNANTLSAIDLQYSKQRVKEQIAEIEDRVFDRDGNVKRDADPDAVLDMGTGQIRAFDAASGFQSGHVSDCRPGDWKRQWTDQQKQIVNDAIRKARRDGKAHKE